MLDRREQALAAGDLDGWMATVDPKASPQVRAAEQRAFEGWRSMPVDRFSLEARTEDTGDLAEGIIDRLGSKYGAEEVMLPETRRRHRLAGIDDRDGFDRLWLTYVRRGDQWYVAGSDDLAHLGLLTGVTLWELGPVAVQRTEHFLLVSPPGLSDRAAEIATTAEEAHRLFSARWDQPWSGRLPIILPASIADLEQILQTTFDLTSFVAFVAFDTVRDDGYEPTAPRMYIQDTNLSRHTQGFQLDTLIHELVHAASSSRSGPLVELWVHEGVAEWITDNRPLGGDPPGGVSEVPSAHQFTTGSGASILQAYRASTSFVRHLAEVAGPAAPIRLFNELGARRAVPGSNEHNIDEVLHEITGSGLADLEASWRG